MRDLDSQEFLTHQLEPEPRPKTEVLSTPPFSPERPSDDELRELFARLTAPLTLNRAPEGYQQIVLRPHEEQRQFKDRQGRRRRYDVTNYFLELRHAEHPPLHLRNDLDFVSLWKTAIALAQHWKLPLHIQAMPDHDNILAQLTSNTDHIGFTPEQLLCPLPTRLHQMGLRSEDIASRPFKLIEQLEEDRLRLDTSYFWELFFAGCILLMICGWLYFVYDVYQTSRSPALALLIAVPGGLLGIYFVIASGLDKPGELRLTPQNLELVRLGAQADEAEQFPYHQLDMLHYSPEANSFYLIFAHQHLELGLSTEDAQALQARILQHSLRQLEEG